jgi:hypothetical protein
MSITPEQLDRAHLEALAENIAHDAAMVAAQPLTPELLARFADRRRQLPETLRNRRRNTLAMVRVPPGRYA